MYIRKINNGLQVAEEFECILALAIEVDTISKWYDQTETFDIRSWYVYHIKGNIVVRKNIT